MGLTQLMYYISKGEETEGPVDYAELARRVAAGEIDGCTLVCQEGWSEWQEAASVVKAPPVLPNPLDAAVPLVQADRPQISAVREKVKSLLTQLEVILGIAAQALPGLSHEAVVATNRRLILFRPRFAGLGMSFEDWFWIDVQDVHIEETILGATFSVTGAGRRSFISRLNKEEARALYRLSQELEECARVDRRTHDLQRLKAGASNISIGQPKQ